MNAVVRLHDLSLPISKLNTTYASAFTLLFAYITKDLQMPKLNATGTYARVLCIAASDKEDETPDEESGNKLRQ